MLCLALTCACIANLASFLVNQNYELQIKSFHDVIANDLRVCVQKGSGDIVDIQSEYQTGTHAKKLDELEIHKGLANDECKVALVNKESHKSYKNQQNCNLDCNLKIEGLPVRTRSSSFALKSSAERCSSIIRDVLDTHLIEIIDDSALNKITKDHHR